MAVFSFSFMYVRKHQTHYISKPPVSQANPPLFSKKSEGMQPFSRFLLPALKVSKSEQTQKGDFSLYTAFHIVYVSFPHLVDNLWITPLYNVYSCVKKFKNSYFSTLFVVYNSILVLHIYPHYPFFLRFFYTYPQFMIDKIHNLL